MLTKQDLQQIGNVIDEKLKPVNKNIASLTKGVSTLTKDVSTLKKDVAQTRNDVKVLISYYFDREYVELRKRIDRIEEHLNLDTKN